MIFPKLYKLVRNIDELDEVTAKWKQREAEGYERRFYGAQGFYGWGWFPVPFHKKLWRTLKSYIKRKS